MECGCELPLLHDKKFDFWYCSACGSEWWPATGTLKEIEAEKQSRAYQEQIDRQSRWHITSVRAQKPLLSFSYVPGTRGDSSRPGGKRRRDQKKRSQDPSWLPEEFR